MDYFPGWYCLALNIAFCKPMILRLVQVRQTYRLISCHANSFSLQEEHDQLSSLKWYIDM